MRRPGFSSHSRRRNDALEVEKTQVLADALGLASTVISRRGAKVGYVLVQGKKGRESGSHRVRRG